MGERPLPARPGLRALFCAVYGMTELDLGLTSLANDSLRELGLTYAERGRRALSSDKLWQQDVNRRFMLKARHLQPQRMACQRSAGSCPTPMSSRQAARRQAVRPVDVAGIRQMAATFRSLDNTHGGGYVRDQAVRYLDREVAPS